MRLAVARQHTQCTVGKTCAAWACRFGDLFHDWPDSYFKALASRGGNLAGVFKQWLLQCNIHYALLTRHVLHGRPGLETFFVTGRTATSKPKHLEAATLQASSSKLWVLPKHRRLSSRRISWPECSLAHASHQCLAIRSVTQLLAILVHACARPWW